MRAATRSREATLRVAGRVAVHVVDRLEPVEVEQEQGNAAVRRRGGERRVQRFVEPAAVRQVGQRIGARDFLGLRERDLQAGLAARRESCRDQEHRAQGEPRHLQPGAVVQLGCAGDGKRLEVGAEGLDARRVDRPKIGVLRTVEQCPGRFPVALAREPEGRALHRHQVVVRLVGCPGERRADLRRRERDSLGDGGIQLGAGLVVALDPPGLARHGGHLGRHRQPFVQVGDAAAKLGDPDGALGREPHLLPRPRSGPAKPRQQREDAGSRHRRSAPPDRRGPSRRHPRLGRSGSWHSSVMPRIG